MERLPIEENGATRERLVATVKSLSDAEFASAIDGGWTIAQSLAQLAFWDRWAEQLLRRWRSGQMPPPSVPDWYDDAINQALIAQWRAIPVGAAGALAVEASAAVDHQIAHLETPVQAAITASGESSHLVHRHRYRAAALDRIDRTLGRTGN